MDFNIAFFTREVGNLSTARANRGMTAELAFRQHSVGQRRAYRQEATGEGTDSGEGETAE